MSGLYAALILLIAVAVVVISLVIILKGRKAWSQQDRQRHLDYQIKKALDSGDHYQAEQLRQEKLRLLVNNE